MRSRPWLSVLIVFLGVLVVDSQATPQDKDQPPYDLVIRNGKIVDGTGNPWYHGDLAVKGAKIAAMGKIAAGAGTKEIDAKGLIVAPGFVDIHSHSEYTILQDGNAESKIRQGVTTEVIGESTSPGPFQGELFPHEIKIKDKMERLTTLGDYFGAVSFCDKTVANVCVSPGQRADM